METILKMADETVSCIYNGKDVNEHLIYENLMDSQNYFIPTIISIFKGNPNVEVIDYNDIKALSRRSEVLSMVIFDVVLSESYHFQIESYLYHNNHIESF